MSEGPPAATSGAAGTSALRSWITLALLFAVALSNYMDRAIITILQVPIKAELGLSDTQLGLMTGLAFAICYTVLGLPVARLADRTSRKGVLAAAVFIWSMMTVACGFAVNFLGIFAARVGVAVGESAGAPVSHTLVAREFPRRGRAFAMALWMLAVPMGAMLGLGLGGALSDWIGWRKTFIVLGLSGAVLAPLSLFIIRSDGQRVKQDKTRSALNWTASLKILWKIRTYRLLCLAGLVKGFGTFALYSWSAPFYMRVFDISLSQAGLYLALMAGIGGSLGILVAGFLTDLKGRRDARWYVLMPAITATILTPAALTQFLTNSLPLSLLAGLLAASVTNAHSGPVVSTVQTIVPEPHKAFASAILVLVSSLPGLSVAPLMIGIASDLLAANGAPPSAIRYAISALLITPALAGLIYVLASRHVTRDLDQVQAEPSVPLRAEPEFAL